MKVCGIIAEYNPFHNGHAYHLEKVREKGATHIVAVMSPNFVQRGDVALFSKFTRATAALSGGVDLVIELPVTFAVSSAERFARAGVWLLHALGCVDMLDFGSESGSIDALRAAAHAAVDGNHPAVQAQLKKGMSYPTAVAMAAREAAGRNGDEVFDLLSSPNNLLGITYLKALEEFHSPIQPSTTQRFAVAHDSMQRGGDYASASYIRGLLSCGDPDVLDLCTPPQAAQLYRKDYQQGKYASMSALEDMVLYRLRSMQVKEMAKLPDVSEGLENRLYRAVRQTTSYEDLLRLVKTKRYTLARIRRILISALLTVNKNRLLAFPPYVRILGSNQKGLEILARMKTTCLLPVDFSLSRLGQESEKTRECVEMESRATDIFELACAVRGECGSDYTAKPIILS